MQFERSALEGSSPISRPTIGRQLRAAVVLNPKAGTGVHGFSKLLRSHLSPDAVRYELILTQGPGDAERIAREAAAEGYDMVVAVGGDGTVNEVGRGLLRSKSTSMAIVPTGSGNGVARHLGIPINIAGALRRLNNPSLKMMDVGRINGHPFFCTAGLGFDAHVSKCFTGSKQRGLLTYARLALREYQAFKAKPISLRLNGVSTAAHCYVLAFANAAQYGNNVYIAPFADVADGLLDVCLIQDMPIRRALRVAYGLAVGDLPKSRAAIYHKASEIVVTSGAPIGFHVDGDYMGECDRFEVSLSPLAISVCV
ncbi:MAG: YegS/Rv2252/BmrU family lipid kinase [Phenylobacterium sp.]|uniref:diacylglycerol/lipid kinase family protein n=1 Tax=Phenylobacterium sp. TaxID=1871053 RepID=UPI002735C93A|nr:YegS/Rv2252/BmrU family lipid kinase [Phenylobacterium sp.]MDP3750100.1 YegS/Rv2252/BmrU family lipid kinase [Phenylobacterium sp.]